MHDLDRGELAASIPTEEDLAHPADAEPTEKPIRPDLLRVVLAQRIHRGPPTLNHATTQCKERMPAR
jgi:hypothetical protein